MKWPYSRSVQAGIWASAAARVSAAAVMPAGDGTSAAAILSGSMVSSRAAGVEPGLLGVGHPIGEDVESRPGDELLGRVGVFAPRVAEDVGRAVEVPGRVVRGVRVRNRDRAVRGRPRRRGWRGPRIGLLPHRGEGVPRNMREQVRDVQALVLGAR